MNFNDLSIQQKKIRPKITDAINKVLDHGKYIMGPEVELLEAELSNYIGAKYCITCANGTDALQLALMALGVGPGDEVITTAFSFVATSEAIALLKATPVFVDINPDTYSINVEQVRKSINSNTKAIIPVSLYGLMPDMEALNEIELEYGIPIIEDGAQSFGASCPTGKSGASSTIATTSFFPSKPLGCYGDGGAVFTSDFRIASKLRSLRLHGQQKKYVQTSIGINSRLDTIQSAILLEKIKILDEEISNRKVVADRYSQLLSSTIRCPRTPKGYKHVFAQYTIEHPQRDELKEHLAKNSIPSMVYYPILLSDQESMSEKGKVYGDLTYSKQAQSKVLSLPMHPYLTESEQNRVAKAILEFR